MWESAKLCFSHFESDFFKFFCMISTFCFYSHFNFIHFDEDIWRVNAVCAFLHSKDVKKTYQALSENVWLSKQHGWLPQKEKQNEFAVIVSINVCLFHTKFFTSFFGFFFVIVGREAWSQVNGIHKVREYFIDRV